MRVVIVEDRPWNMVKSIGKIRELGITVQDIIFVANDNVENGDMNTQRQELQQTLDLRITVTNRYDFKTTMDQFYADKENLFFCDLNLSGNRVFFDERENVRYAANIMEREGKLDRIWFYTTAGEATNEQINTRFPGKNISVETVDEEQQVILDMSEIRRILVEM